MSRKKHPIDFLGIFNDRDSCFEREGFGTGKFALRLCVGKTHTAREHVEKAWEMIQKEVKDL
jgi:hypothetical protein